ncbi:unnamed protein product [Albugo candida]|uniref:Uncharacterized protein n=1 Tax=Albugo candida TaxID=65357 RepID=A0A024G0E0_9STRA|nr:unnamed protein product [Albugo candida]|eukprot:CCI40307.1 unnamed protein product [Albugo candida]
MTITFIFHEEMHHTVIIHKPRLSHICLEFSHLFVLFVQCFDEVLESACENWRTSFLPMSDGVEGSPWWKRLSGSGWNSH